MSELNPNKVYRVFARYRYEEPLHYVGEVCAPDDDLAKVYAFNTFNEWAWIEMVVVPRSAVVSVIEPA